jgi:hypothetical protein
LANANAAAAPAAALVASLDWPGMSLPVLGSKPSTSPLARAPPCQPVFR